MYKEAGGICSLCGEPIKYFSQSTIDHVVPKSKGGSDNDSNLKIAHDFCNRKKGDDLPVYDVSVRLSSIVTDNVSGSDLYPAPVVLDDIKKED